ncbi:MAG: universal stress protein [Pseudomonadota bacterium]
MAYKSILTVVMGGSVEGAALPGAIAMAKQHDAHLEVLALGVDHSTPGYYYAGANAMIEQQAVDRARDEAAQSEAAVCAAMEGLPVRWSVVTGVAQIGTIQHIVGGHARFSDLVVLPKPYGDGRSSADEAVLEAALFSGHVPVLVLPDGQELDAPRRIVIAWNQSPEAMGAIRAALPLLVEADLSNIVIIDPPRHSADRSDPGGYLSQMLSRHGAKPEVAVIAGTMPKVADVLARHCMDKDADLLVMGAYGHSRFREALLGGATRDVLEGAPLPVLMHH